MSILPAGARRPDVKVSDSTRAPDVLRGREVDRIHARLAGEVGAVAAVVIRESPERAEVTVYGYKEQR